MREGEESGGIWKLSSQHHTTSECVRERYSVRDTEFLTKIKKLKFNLI